MNFLPDQSERHTRVCTHADHAQHKGRDRRAAQQHEGVFGPVTIEVKADPGARNGNTGHRQRGAV